MSYVNTNLSVVDTWNQKSAETISLLQEKLYPYEWWILQCSGIGTKEMITILFPIAAGFLNILGIKLLWAVILSEWSNLILKWIFKGDRPYWWIQQHLYASTFSQQLKQFPSTCESGPGTPSGHLMLNVAIFYVIARGISKHFIWQSKNYNCSKLIMSLLLFGLFEVWIAGVFVSRLYIQAHFIHQCVFGVLLGLVVGCVAWSCNWLTRSHNVGFIVFANILVGSSLLTYGLLLSYGLDPLWAVPLAMKYCERPEFVNIDTQPYYIIVRFSALALGLGFSVNSKNRKIATSSKSFLRTILTLKAGLLVGRLLSLIQSNLSQEDLLLYLCTNFVLHLLYPYLVVSTIPYLLHALYPSK